MAYHRQQGVDTAIVRIFNTYGPRMRPFDGRAIPTFVRQALAGLPLTIFGDGTQTRSFCYVSDLIRGLIALAESGYHEPVNIGNPDEFTLLDARRGRARGDRQLIADRLRRAAGRRPQAAPAGHHARSRAARLVAGGLAARRARADARQRRPLTTHEDTDDRRCRPVVRGRHVPVEWSPGGGRGKRHRRALSGPRWVRSCHRPPVKFCPPAGGERLRDCENGWRSAYAGASSATSERVERWISQMASPLETIRVAADPTPDASPPRLVRCAADRARRARRARQAPAAAVVPAALVDGAPLRARRGADGARLRRRLPRDLHGALLKDVVRGHASLRRPGVPPDPHDRRLRLPGDGAAVRALGHVRRPRHAAGLHADPRDALPGDGRRGDLRDRRRQRRSYYSSYYVFYGSFFCALDLRERLPPALRASLGAAAARRRLPPPRHARRHRRRTSTRSRTRSPRRPQPEVEIVGFISRTPPPVDDGLRSLGSLGELGGRDRGEPGRRGDRRRPRLPRARAARADRLRPRARRARADRAVDDRGPDPPRRVRARASRCRCSSCARRSSRASTSCSSAASTWSSRRSR